MNNNLIFIASTLIVGILAIGCAKSKTLLTAYIALMGVLANLFVLKQIELFGFNATASDVYAVGSILALNLMREYYDLSACKKAISISFFCMAFFMIMGQMHLFYTPSAFDTSQSAYQAILTPTPRIMAASMLVFFSVQIFDIYFYNYFVRKAFKPLWLRSGFSLIISQGLDTILFTYIGLYGLISNLDEILLISFTIKLIAISCMIPFTQLSRRWVRA